MLVRPRWLALPPAVFLLGSFASCAVDPAAGISLDMHAPAGLLDQATAVKLSVFDPKGAMCDATGSAGTIPSTAKVFQLTHTGCSTAGTWCGSLTLPEDGSTKMFAVEVSNASGILALGCTTAKISQDPLAVSIKIVRYIPPACCNNGTLETGELCDTGMASGAACSMITPTEACAADCTTNEIPVDHAKGSPAAPVGAMTQLALTFAPGMGQLQNGLRAVYSDNSNGSNPDVDVRYLTADATGVTAPVLLASPLKIPLRCSNPSGPGQARNQNSPAVATLSTGNVAVVYLSDELVPGTFNLFATALDQSGCAENNAVQVNTTAGGATTPDVAAAASGKALIVWVQNGSMFGRLFDGTAVDPTVITLGAGSTPRVAATQNGFVVAYAGSAAADPDGVYYETVSTTGQVGTPVLVNAKTVGVQDQPAIATFADGRFAIAFRSSGDIFIQRYDAMRAAVSGDQDAAFDTTNPGGQASPSIAAGTSPTQGDFFVAAWQTSTGDIAARLAGASSGFLFNQVNGQNSDFVVNVAGEAGSRTRPVVTVGGNSFIVFGWEDASPSHPGVFVRRFPLPQ